MDVLATTRHIDRWREDLDLLKDRGVRDLRYPAPWHRLEPSPGRFDFSDGLAHGNMRDCGMNPVIDLLHHTSFPD